MLTGIAGQESPAPPPAPGSNPGYDARPPVESSPADYASNGLSGAPTMASTSPYGGGASSSTLPAQPVRGPGAGAAMPAAAVTGGTTVAPAPPAQQTQAASRVVPKGAIELLPEESVVFQLGALYLTNKRVILLAPSVVRAAFLQDVDAVGTLTERSSGWSLFFGLVFLALAATGGYFSIARTQFQANLPLLYTIDPMFVGIALAVFGIVLLVMYFIWVKRTLFISVSGRPLITVSVADWNSRKLEGMDAFVNAYFQVKDMLR